MMSVDDVRWVVPLISTTLVVPACESGPSEFNREVGPFFSVVDTVFEEPRRILLVDAALSGSDVVYEGKSLLVSLEDAEVVIEDEDGSRHSGSVFDIAAGDSVHVWIRGPVRKPLPAQATASRVVVMKGGATSGHPYVDTAFVDGIRLTAEVHHIFALAIRVTVWATNPGTTGRALTVRGSVEQGSPGEACMVALQVWKDGFSDEPVFSNLEGVDLCVDREQLIQLAAGETKALPVRPAVDLFRAIPDFSLHSDYVVTAVVGLDQAFLIAGRIGQ